ncbi:MAG: ATP-binding protein [Lachnospiraceae bacterium]|nr:ATP-binding protein [Lachnospiraceae bacterium]
MKTLCVAAEAGRLDEVLSFIGSCLEGTQCSPKVQMQLDVAVEEMFVNIACYAYEGSSLPDEERNAWIEAGMIDTDGVPCVRVTLKDKGIPYDPLAKEDPDITLSAEDRKVGGLGIFMVKKSMDHVAYEYKEGMNVFTMEKKLS